MTDQPRTADVSDTWFHKPFRRNGFFDEVVIGIEPRYKQSEISGDEWRHNYFAEIRAKGKTILTVTGLDLEDATLQVLRFAMGHCVDDVDGIEVSRVVAECCDQPGCRDQPTYFYQLKQEFSSQGEALDESEVHFRKYRKFCEMHKTRGDGSREDCDDNYLLLSGDPMDRGGDD